MEPRDEDGEFIVKFEAGLTLNSGRPGEILAWWSRDPHHVSLARRSIEQTTIEEPFPFLHNHTIMTISEIVLFSLKPGLDIDTASSEGEQLKREVFTTISQQPGCQAIYYGREVEKPDILEAIFGSYPQLDMFQNPMMVTKGGISSKEAFLKPI